MGSEKQDALKLLSLIAGQLGDIRQMVETEQYCGDILRQTSAIRRALKQVEALLLEYHLHHGFSEDIKGRGKEDVVGELIQMIHLVDQR